jgi:uncharacterized membrane protein
MSASTSVYIGIIPALMSVFIVQDGLISLVSNVVSGFLVLGVSLLERFGWWLFIPPLTLVMGLLVTIFVLRFAHVSRRCRLEDSR